MVPSIYIRSKNWGGDTDVDKTGRQKYQGERCGGI